MKLEIGARVEPEVIQARDGDTLDTAITYSIVGGKRPSEITL